MRQDDAILLCPNSFEPETSMFKGVHEIGEEMTSRIGRVVTKPAMSQAENYATIAL